MNYHTPVPFDKHHIIANHAVCKGTEEGFVVLFILYTL